MVIIMVMIMIMIIWAAAAPTFSSVVCFFFPFQRQVSVASGCGKPRQRPIRTAPPSERRAQYAAAAEVDSNEKVNYNVIFNIIWDITYLMIWAMTSHGSIDPPWKSALTTDWLLEEPPRIDAESLR